MSDIEYTVDGAVATVRFNRPDRLNAMTSAMADEVLPALCREVAEDPSVRVLVLTGTGRAFCAGADLDARLPDVKAGAGLTRPVGGFAAAVWGVPKPVIAAVNGVAAGGGMSLACAADFRLVAASARFVPAFTRRGLMPDGGLTHTLPLLVGRSRAVELLLTGTAVDADEALRIGLADRVVADDSLDAAAGELAARLAQGPPVALSFTKRALQRADDFAGQLEFESWGQRICLGTADFTEGVAAFRERREPEFEGR